MNSYLLFKSLHLIAVFSWMAGLLYLPRIFVYHVENKEKKEATDIFEVMEKRLFFYIMRPAMIFTWIFGLILIYLNGIEIFSELWIQIKIVLVVLLSVYNDYLGKCLKSLKNSQFIATIAAMQPDIMVVSAYGLIIPKVLLDLPRHGCVNVHASLLPRWRGAAPIQRAMLAGDVETGISLMKMEAALDAGPIYAQASLEIDPRESAGELHDRLAQLGGELLKENLSDILLEKLHPSKQDEKQASYAKKIFKDDGNHARSAVSCNSLPKNASVEIDSVFQLGD